VSLGTDYIARGTSQTYNKPAITIYAEHQEGKFYTGGFAANVDFDDGTQIEADLLGGYRTSIGKTNIDLGAIYVTYHGKQTTNWNMVEVHAAANRQFGPVNANLYVGVSPNYFNYAGRSVWTEFTGSTPVGKSTFSAAIAYQYIEKDVSYATWNVGVSYPITKSLTLDARYYDTDWKPVGVKYLDKIYAPRAVLTLKKAF